MVGENYFFLVVQVLAETFILLFSKYLKEAMNIFKIYLFIHLFIYLFIYLFFYC